MNKKAKVIAILNQKGGVAKTTTAFNMAHCLHKTGKKVLLIDLDPQGSLTICCGIERPDNIKNTIYGLIKAEINGEKINKEEYILKKEIHLIPCNIELSIAEMNLVGVISRETILKQAVEDIKENYDYIIIDCMPSLGILTVNALTACDSVLITVTPQYLSAKSLELLLKTIIKVKRNLNTKINIDGILITMFNERTNLSKEILSLIKDAYEDNIKVFKTTIPTSVKIGEANLQGKSIIEYAPKHKTAIAYNQFTKEYMRNENK